MKKDKVLIYRNINMLKQSGGPNGYLYNLKKGLDTLGENNILFLDEPIIKRKEYKSNLRTFIKSIFSKAFPRTVKNHRMIALCDSILNGKKENNKVNFNDYDYIHFHETFDMYGVRDSLENYKGKIILTSHSPKPLYQEYVDNCINETTSKRVRDRYNSLEKIDEYAFEKADYIFFPCEEAEEPYYNQWEKYEKIKKENKEKYRYILTGVPSCSAKVPRSEIRKKYNIPENAFLISYIGRHNKVKGYDLLKQIGEEVLKNDNIYIIVAGKEGPIYKLDNEKWKEIGWANDPYSIISASDLFVLPNRETYFDIVLIEILALGVPILASYTGGNKYFKKYPESGIYYFTKTEEAIKRILEISNVDKEALKELGKKNKEIFNRDFNEIVFAKNYINLIESLR